MVCVTQTAQSRAVEEAQAKAAGLEAAVAAAKGEAKGAMQKAEALQQQLTAAEDAVKVREVQQSWVCLGQWSEQKQRCACAAPSLIS